MLIALSMNQGQAQVISLIGKKDTVDTTRFNYQWDLPKVSVMTCLSWSRTVEMKWTMNLLQLKRLMPSLCPLYDVSLCEPRDVSEFFT